MSRSYASDMKDPLFNSTRVFPSKAFCSTLADSSAQYNFSTTHADPFSDSVTYCLRRDGLFISGSPSRSNACSTSYMLRLLDGVYFAFRQYFKQPLTGDLIRKRYPEVLMLLEELLLGGMPLTTESNNLDVILCDVGSNGSSILGQLSQLVGSTRGSSFTNSLTGVSPEVWWRRADVFHGANEFYLDVTEKINCVVSSQGKIVSGSIHGSFGVNSKLSGLPELLLSLKEGDVKNALKKSAISFHPSVRIPKWEQESKISFIPPDGTFVLAEYTLTKIPPNVLPVHVTVKLLSIGQLTVHISPRLTPQTVGKPSIVENVVVGVNVPSCSNMTLVTQSGTARYDRTSHTAVWSIPQLSQPGKLDGQVSFDKNASLTTESVPCSVSLQFSVRAWAASGIRVDSVQISNVNYTPQKGCRYSTVSGSIDLRF